MGYGTPFTVKAVKRSESVDEPLILPPCSACSTVPEADEPPGMATRPWLETACATEAVNLSPGLLEPEPSAVFRRTAITVPAGRTTGGGGGGAGAGASC